MPEPGLLSDDTPISCCFLRCRPDADVKFRIVIPFSSKFSRLVNRISSDRTSFLRAIYTKFQVHRTFGYEIFKRNSKLVTGEVRQSNHPRIPRSESRLFPAGTPASGHLPARSLASSGLGTPFSRSVFGLRCRQRLPIHAEICR